MVLHVRKRTLTRACRWADTHPSLPPPALGHQSDKDPRHLHPAVCAFRLPALRGAAGGHFQTHRGLVCAGLPLLCGHHPDHYRIWRLCGRYQHEPWKTTKRATMAEFLRLFCPISRRFRNRVLGLLQTGGVVLDPGGTRLLCCNPQHDRILAEGYLQED